MISAVPARSWWPKNISKEHLNAMIYSGPEAYKCLYLYHHDNHYDVITSMPAFLARKQYCHKCKKGCDKITSHPCGDLCKLCNTQNCSLVEWKFCKDCNRFFKSNECFNRHKDDAGPISYPEPSLSGSGHTS